MNELIEDIIEPIRTKSPDCEELIHQLNEEMEEDEYMSWKLHYSSNFTVSQLKHIANYYGISMRKLKKYEIIKKIIEFENNTENGEIVLKRRELWDYIGEIQNDNYLSKYLIIKI